jgi:hypothetical protein
MGKIVIIPTEDNKKKVAYKSSNNGRVEELSEMNYKHFQNAFDKWNKDNNTDHTYNAIRQYPDEALICLVLSGEAAKRVLLERDWSKNKELEELQAKVDELQKQINAFKA